MAGDGDNPDEFSYSFLKWNLKSIPEGSKLVGATLIVIQVANPEMTSEAVKESPLQARPMPTGFTEKGWQHSMLSKLTPAAEPKAVFGAIVPGEKKVLDANTVFEIDLMKGPGNFKAYWEAAWMSESKDMALALTASLDPSSSGRGVIYKLFSKDGPKEHRPVLRLKFEALKP